MKEIVQFLVSLIIILPYLMTLFLFFSLKVSRKSSVRSFRIAADITVPLLFLSVCVLLRVVANIHADFFLLAGVLVTGIGFAVAERIRSKDFRIQYMLRNFWRMLFLILSLFYLVLLLLGVVKNVVEFLKG
ncbi:DUF3397 family protein [Sporosarcina gallistercoris]|uniref:DUF3397 family protein n=1 Tax=Sporosarcina gallistercoris TaxID=2762245 RepID=A0ABR8PGD0_9BACL|nr:DUF3397 family protein [Sporosarcina gallistercoris]MBD7907222.1 DUF3397 family protein [Sporosarcina gallistercoris]